MKQKKQCIKYEPKTMATAMHAIPPDKAWTASILTTLTKNEFIYSYLQDTIEKSYLHFQWQDLKVSEKFLVSSKSILT